MLSKPLLAIVLAWSVLFSLEAQQKADQVREIYGKKIQEEIKIDGLLNEAIWQKLAGGDGFWQYFPEDSVQAEKQTEIYIAYDDEYIYVAARCYSAGRNYVVPSLKRDYRAGGSDNLTILFDPFNDRTNAFVFGLNPYGVTREALISNGGVDIGRDWDTSWDNKWIGDAKMQENSWTAEFAIPFKTIRFNEGSTEWRFNSYRFDTQSSERSTWMPIPRNQLIVNLAYMGRLQWEAPLKKTGQNLAVIPYTIGGLERDFVEDDKTSNRFNAGLDAKVAVTSGLNLDLTINPDFSQVEVDRQVVDLSRFELFFPERRQFFLENADLFGSFGSRRTTPFFSRRIGVAKDTSTGQSIQNTILYGARLSGKLGDNWRVGLLNMQTAKDEDISLPGFNHTVAAVQRRIFQGSSIGAIFVNKQRLSDKDNNNELSDPYNRVIGLDYNLGSASGRWNGKVFYHQSITANDSLDNQYAHGFRLNYNTRRVTVGWDHRLVGDGYDAQLGFVRRTNLFRIRPEVRLFFYPDKEGGIVNLYNIGARSNIYWEPNNRKTDHLVELFMNVNFANTARISLTLQNDYTYLFDAFDPSGTDANPLPAATDYNYTSFSASFSTDRRKAFSFRLEPSIGQYFNGKRYNLGGSLNYRLQPFGVIGLNADYNIIDLPNPYAQTDILLLGPRIDLTFTKSLFLTTFFQYNSQIDNININMRFQWRFRPVSDFFIVYTDNYTADFSVKTRAIVAKFSYWLNL